MSQEGLPRQGIDDFERIEECEFNSKKQKVEEENDFDFHFGICVFQCS